MIDREKYTLEIARTLEDVEKIRGIWEQMQGHPNAEINFYLTILASRPEIIRPHVMVIVDNDGSETVVVGRIEERRLEFKLGYLTIYRPKVRMLTVVHGGVMGNVSGQGAKRIVAKLLDGLKQEDADVLLLSNLPVDSDLYAIARSEPSVLCRDTVAVRHMHWQMTMPSTLESFYGSMSSNRRHQLRRYGRVLEKRYPGEVSFVAFSKEEDADKVCHDAEEIARKTYHRGLGVGFVHNEENRQRIALSARNGWLHAYMLYVAERPCAFLIGTLYRGTLHLNFTGYDPDFRKFEVGTILFTRMIDDLCHQDVKEVDFGTGDAFYKQRFCDKGWEESSLYVFSGTLRGVRLNMTRTLVVVVAGWLRRLVEKLAVAQKIKRIWRGKLAPTTESVKEG
jgi:hypothetical protein